MVIGGTGGFGRRLVEGLITTTDVAVIVAARNVERASALAAALDPNRTSAAAIDRATVTPAQLRASGATVVVDAAGPYQGADYRVARAAFAAGIHYLDLADGRDFVGRFAALDAEACAAGVVALTGASSTPALSNAVLDRLTAGWRQIESIDIAISPGNRGAPRGLAVIRSILSYAGRPTRVFDGGAWIMRPGWGMLERRELAGLGWRWLSLCETPDLDLVPERFAPRSSALFRAGLELTLLHFGLLIATLPVRARLLPSLLPFARLFRWVGERFTRFGSDRGGMLVEATGIGADGVATRASWSLLATFGDGPIVPTLPALAVLRAFAAGNLPEPGARACVGLVDLAALEREFARHHIETTLSRLSVMSPFQSILGADFSQLPQPVRRLHGLAEGADTAGRAEITAPRNPFAWLLCRLAGLPLPGSDVPVTVSFHPDRRGGEYWRRRFAGRRYASAMHAGEGADAGLLVERFWPFIYVHQLAATAKGVAWRLVKWRLFGVPLPRWTLPTVNCFESADGERFVFDIDVVFPMIGPVIHYRGWLLPVEQLTER